MDWTKKGWTKTGRMQLGVVFWVKECFESSGFFRIQDFLSISAHTCPFYLVVIEQQQEVLATVDNNNNDLSQRGEYRIIFQNTGFFFYICSDFLACLSCCHRRTTRGDKLTTKTRDVGYSWQQQEQLTSAGQIQDYFENTGFFFYIFSDFLAIFI